MIDILTHDFKKSFQVGIEGELEILEYLKSSPNVAGVVDVRDRKEYQEQDVDFVALLEKEVCVKWIEVKTDTYTTGNFFYETISNMERGTPGCMEKTQADYLFYYFIVPGELYIIPLPEFREWFAEHHIRSCFKRKLLKNYCGSEGETYTTEGYTFPKWYFESDFKGFRKVILRNKK